MAYVIAGLMAALSFLLNRAMLQYVGAEAIVTYGPAMEEGAKTVLAYCLGADILLTHVTFGVIEATYDIVTARYKAVAAILSVGGHGLFGFITIWGLALTGNIVFSLAVPIAAHWAWNITVIRLLHRKDSL
ncbi:MAG: hypothetical protein H6Q73_787 [Firmicutes bacterium]|nr:hypothetical protein [Bacillota bacterium]